MCGAYTTGPGPGNPKALGRDAAAKARKQQHSDELIYDIIQEARPSPQNAAYVTAYHMTVNGHHGAPMNQRFARHATVTSYATMGQIATAEGVPAGDCLADAFTLAVNRTAEA